LAGFYKEDLMRGRVFGLAALLAILTFAPLPIGALSTTTATADVVQEAQPKDVNVDIDVGGRGGAWYTNTWVILAVVGVVLLVVIIALLAGRGGTTIIKE
jgi:hypothetical protein